MISFKINTTMLVQTRAKQRSSHRKSAYCNSLAHNEAANASRLVLDGLGLGGGLGLLGGDLVGLLALHDLREEIGVHYEVEKEVKRQNKYKIQKLGLNEHKSTSVAVQLHIK